MMSSDQPKPPDPIMSARDYLSQWHDAQRYRAQLELLAGGKFSLDMAARTVKLMVGDRMVAAAWCQEPAGDVAICFTQFAMREADS